ncbi:hypothetical protein ACIRRH_11315 [Kitasatospora sp. NPDC101235]
MARERAEPDARMQEPARTREALDALTTTARIALEAQRTAG